MQEIDVIKLIENLEGASDNVRVITRGTTNVVGVSGNKVFRFPLDNDARRTQLFEFELLKAVNNELNIKIPKPIRIYEDPLCVTVSYIEGEHVSTDELKRLPSGVLERIINQLLVFSIELNKNVSIEKVYELEESFLAKVEDRLSWQDYLARWLKNTSFPNDKWLQELATKQYDIWKNMTSQSKLPKIVVHDDLQVENILFENMSINGIVDFGDSTVGTISQELRQLYRINQKAVNYAVRQYKKLTGIDIDEDEVETWSITQELAAYCRWYAKDNRQHQSYKRAQSNLKSWLPEFEDQF